jgi:hypothetical protein
MQDRRAFLLSGVAFAAILPFVGSGGQPAVRRYGKFFLVNGWVLTADDIRALATRAV